MNIIILNRIIELTEPKSRFYKIKNIVTNWKGVVVVSIVALTLKVIAEQIVLAIR
jgi:hypothetical protein